MIALIVSDKHILLGEWNSDKGTFSLEDLKYIPLSNSIKEDLKSQNALHTNLKSAIDRFQLKDKDVVIAIDDDLLYHDKFTTDESISNKEIWDYIQWETKQKWGELGSFYTTFAEKDSTSASILHCVTCPSFLISEIKTIVANKRGNPIWAGPISSIFLENKEISNGVYMIDDESFVKFYFRGRDGYSEGKLRFISGQPSISVLVGEKEEQAKLFKIKNDVFKFVTIDLIPDSKNSNLRQYKPQRMIPFEGIVVNVEDIPENISFKILNTLSVLIKDFSFKYLINFFNPNQIQEKNYEGLGKIGFDEDGKRIEEKSTTSKLEPKREKNSKKNKKVRKKRKSYKKKRSLLPYLLLVLLGAIVYYFIFNDSGKDILSTVKEKIGITDSKNRTYSLIYFDNQLNKSKGIIKTYNDLTSFITTDSIEKLELLNNSGSIEFVGGDSIDIPNIIPTNYSIDSNDDGSGIKQTMTFDLGFVTATKNNIFINSEDVVDQLRNTFIVDPIRVLENITESGTTFTPIILQVDSIDLVNKLIKYFEFIGDNVIVRKISISNSIPTEEFSCMFYISVFEPI